MNREIKFRAWDRQTKKMLSGFSLFGEMMLLGGIHSWQRDCGNNAETSLEALNDLTVMQFTSLKDKNGKEIYEGDIIRIASTGDIKKIFYHKCSFGIDLGNNVFAPIYWHEDIEIIGNIYENPDLLQ